MNSRVTFGELATLRKETVKPKDFSDSIYIGLEHISQGTLELLGHGFGSEVDSQKQRFYKGDVLFGKLRPYFRKVVVAPFDGICSTDIWVVKANQECDKAFLKYWMASEEFISNSTHAAEGSRMPRAQWDWVSTFELPLVDGDTRKAIGTLLAEIDDKIAVNKKLAKVSQEIGETLFKSWFIDFSDSEIDHTVESEVGLDKKSGTKPFSTLPISEETGIPEGWSMAPLTAIAEYRNGLALQKYPCLEGEPGLPVIKIPQLKSGNASGAGFASIDVPSKHVVVDGDILFSWSGALEVELWAGGPGALNQHLFKVVPIDFPKWFVFCATRMHLDEFRSIAASKATTMGHIQRGHLSDALVPVPPKAVLDSASEILTPLFELAITKKIEARNLATLRDKLLGRLISGTLEVPTELLGE